MYCENCGTPVKRDISSATSFQADHREHSDSDASSQIGATCENNTKSSISNDDSTMCAASPSNTSEMKINWKAIGSIISVIFWIAVAIYLFTNHPISDTKGMVFEQYGNIELGEAVERSLTNVKWESTKIDSKTYTVTVTGFSPNWSSMVSVTFDVNYSGDHVFALVSHGMVNGEYFDDAVSNVLAMGILYGSN